MTYKEEREAGKEIAKTIKIGTRCKMEDGIYEVIDIYPYSNKCSSLLYKMIVVNEEKIEVLKQQLKRDKKRSTGYEDYTEEELIQYMTIKDIEPAWFITRKAEIL